MLKQIRILIMILLVLIPATGVQAQQGGSVLLPASESEWLRRSHYIQGSKVGVYWQPTVEQLGRLDGNILKVAAMRSEGALIGAQIEHPEKYARQYVAILLNGRKTIYVSALCDVMSPNPTHLTIVSDGGTCFWQALYDVETQMFSHLTTNGRA